MINRSQGNFSRRAFLGQTAAASAAAFAFPTIIPGSALGLARRPAPSNRITLAVIGTGNQGFNDIKSFLRDDRVQIGRRLRRQSRERRLLGRQGRRP